jgi:CRP-like cAMP-binding protein
VPITPHLSRRLQQALGEEAALEFMNWIQRVDARSSDSVERLETVRADVAEVRQELQIGFVKLLEQMAHLETRFERRFGDLIKWSFVFWVGAVAAIAALAGVLR